jgi:thiamine biosynthesis lipoprotein
MVARLVVTDPAVLPEAEEWLRARMAQVDRACSRFRDDSELAALCRAGGRPTLVSPLLRDLIATALLAAQSTDGDVDPTLGSALAELGYDRDLATLPADGPPVRVLRRPAPGWRRVQLDGDVVTVPHGVVLDLGATAKAWTADDTARTLAAQFGCGVLVALGGDLGTSGPAPASGWEVLVGDDPADQPVQISLTPGHGLATSSTASRQWRRGGRLLAHVLDPRTCQPVSAAWRTVTVAAPTCVAANTASTAALVRGLYAPAWLAAEGLAARLVAPSGRVVTVAGWPAEVAA